MTDTTSKMNVDSIAPQDSQQNAAPMASTGDAKPLDPALLHKVPPPHVTQPSKNPKFVCRPSTIRTAKL